MLTKTRTLTLSALLALSSLCGCASQPPACKPLPLSKSASQSLPSEQQFSRCLREILALGRGELDRISADCSKLLQPVQTE